MCEKNFEESNDLKPISQTTTLLRETVLNCTYHTARYGGTIRDNELHRPLSLLNLCEDALSIRDVMYHLIINRRTVMNNEYGRK